jgi:hypothetical protein
MGSGTLDAAHALQVMTMHEQTTPSQSTLRKARWQTQMAQTKKGLGHLQRGVGRFVRERPLISTAALLAVAAPGAVSLGGPALARLPRQARRLSRTPLGRRVLRMLSSQRALSMLGLEQRRSFWGITLPGVGLLGAGALIGAGALMLLAPGRIASRAERL